MIEDRRVVGTQELMAESFPGSRSVSSGSWLTESAQGRGIGVEMRAAVLHLAFAGLGALEAQTSAWIDNAASQRVSLRLGYLRDGEMLMARRGEPVRHLRFRLTREAWQQNHFDGIELHGLEPCFATPRYCMNLQPTCIIMQRWPPRRPRSPALVRLRRALSAGIAGASGYAGRELARLIAGHPRLTLRTAQARSDGFDALAPDELARCDVAFLCLPHGASRDVRRGARAPRARRSSTSAPTSGSIRTGPTG